MLICGTSSRLIWSRADAINAARMSAKFSFPATAILTSLEVQAFSGRLKMRNYQRRGKLLSIRNELRAWLFRRLRARPGCRLSHDPHQQQDRRDRAKIGQNLRSV